MEKSLTKFKVAFLVLAFLFTTNLIKAVAQKPGYTRYVITKNVINGNVSDSQGGAGYWIKFDGNIIWLDMGFGSQSRYVFNSTRSDGTKLYYFTAYNHGTLSQGSGYVTFYDTYLIVSSDNKTINAMRDRGQNGSVLKIQSANDVGEMIE